MPACKMWQAKRISDIASRVTGAPWHMDMHVTHSRAPGSSPPPPHARHGTICAEAAGDGQTHLATHPALHSLQEWIQATAVAFASSTPCSARSESVL